MKVVWSLLCFHVFKSRHVFCIILKGTLEVIVLSLQTSIKRATVFSNVFILYFYLDLFSISGQGVAVQRRMQAMTVMDMSTIM